MFSKVKNLRLTGSKEYRLLSEADDDESVFVNGDLISQKKLPEFREPAFNSILSLATLILGLATGFGLSHLTMKKSCHSQDFTYSPAQSVVSYSLQKVHPHAPAIYYGHPTTEQTKAWERLLEPVMIRASYEELAQAGESPSTAIELLDGGYLASLGVYHDLHCLRRIRFFLYQDHFYPNITPELRASEQKHIEHCLEALRVATMCSGSTGVWSFEWRPNSTKAEARTAAERSCVDWDALDSWTRERAVGFNPPLKARPTES